VIPWLEPETHMYFGTRFCVPESHTFWRNQVSGSGTEQNTLASASAFFRERFAEFACR